MSLHRTILRPATLLLSSAVLLLAGCGINNGTTLSTDAVAELSGKIHGGPNAVSGATVTLFATTSGGYGATANQLAQTTSGTYGTFSFTRSSYTCPTGQYAYITAVGGNTGSGTNANSVLMAALGPCSNLTQATSINISEATTVAAVYALGNFMSLSGAAGTTVNVGAPAANNAATAATYGTVAACTAASGTTAETCTAAGLGHAFANALNLADSVEQGVYPAGTIYAVTPSNANGSIPQAMLNVVANAVFACVNSSGGTGAGTNCGKLFTYTTPPATSTASPVTPTNTVGALMNLVKYPTLTAANVTNLFMLVPATPAFTPVLSAAPNDYSLAIVYSGLTVGTTTTAFGQAYPPALDYNDNLIGLTYRSATSSTTLGSMTSNGVGNYVYLDTTYTYPRLAATDTLGNVYFSNNRPATGTVSDVIKVSSSGTVSTPIAIPAPGYPYGVAVDSFNNAFVSEEGAVSTSPTILEIPLGTTTATAVTNNSASYVLGPYTYDVAIDPSGDLWTVSETSVANGGTASGTLLNNSATNAPSYNGAVVTTENSAQANGYSVVFDSGGNAWVNNTTTLYKVAVTPKAAGSTTPAAVATAPTSAAGFTITNGTITAASAEFSAIDGGNNIFLPNYTAASSALFEYLSGTGSFIALQPCAAPGGATTCNAGTTAGTYPALYTPSGAIVDSTGSIWVSAYTPNAYVQIIGTAVPAWPQLSYGHQGKEPM